MGCRPSRSSLGKVSDCTSDYNRHYIKEFDKARRKQNKRGGRRRMPTYNAFSSTTKCYDRGHGLGTSKITVRLSTDGSMLEIEQYDDDYDPVDNFTTDYSSPSDHSGLEMKSPKSIAKSRLLDKRLSYGRCGSAPLLNYHVTCVETSIPEKDSDLECTDHTEKTRTDEDRGAICEKTKDFNLATTKDKKGRDNELKISNHDSLTIKPYTVIPGSICENQDDSDLRSKTASETPNQGAINDENEEFIQCVANVFNSRLNECPQTSFVNCDMYQIVSNCFYQPDAIDCVSTKFCNSSTNMSDKLSLSRKDPTGCRKDSTGCRKDSIECRKEPTGLIDLELHQSPSLDSNKTPTFAFNYQPIDEFTTFFNYARPPRRSENISENVDDLRKFVETNESDICEIDGASHKQSEVEIPSLCCNIDSNCFHCQNDNEHQIEDFSRINNTCENMKPVDCKNKSLDSNANINLNVCLCRRHLHGTPNHDMESLTAEQDLQIIEQVRMTPDERRLFQNISFSYTDRENGEGSRKISLSTKLGTESIANYENGDNRLKVCDPNSHKESLEQAICNDIDFQAGKFCRDVLAQETISRNESDSFVPENQVPFNFTRQSLLTECNQLNEEQDCLKTSETTGQSCFCSALRAKQVYKFKSVSMTTNDVSETFHEETGESRSNQLAGFILKSPVSSIKEVVRYDYGRTLKEDIFHDASSCHFCDVIRTFESSAQTPQGNIESSKRSTSYNENEKCCHGNDSFEGNENIWRYNESFHKDDVIWSYGVSEDTDSSDDGEDDIYVDAMETTYV